MTIIEMIKNLAQRNSVVASADVLAVFRELEAKDERIGELEVIATEYAGKFQKAQDANKHLIIISNDDKKRIAELEAKLATPVRLPLLYSPDPWMSPDPDGTWLDKEDVKKSIRAAGFTVEGDE
ncbi:hypothetical protein [Serratia marcescens]|uniref:hypothetical protein n=1 Tax=Serratia marcescens TaxID=615 RepID=UPI00074529C1|nr:hypothetical protein [Serratia marcescens]EME1467128.1 hypothetical protein [Serratia marcescens]MBN3902795.1 hypothetical protein [Serratia marcescens]MBN3912145.1 hypothetical protein [Serratia marcescens]MBN3916957.1 hypothetical protein [Serratia marcescens]MBN3935434.1 hypothetical protein [Serratia marcescens]